ncbi:MAG: hypothetical protein R6V27_06335 [Balneolaceae bacterium]
MKSIVKNLTTLLIVVISFTSAEFVNANVSTADSLGSLTASEQKAQDERMEKVFLYGLDSEVDGVLESTFFNVISYKALNPEFDSQSVNEAMIDIALNGNSHVVRYKAYLALSYMKKQDLFADDSQKLVGYIQDNDSTSTFQVLVDNLQNNQVAENQ